jgi:hypothetical protein
MEPQYTENNEQNQQRTYTFTQEELEEMFAKVISRTRTEQGTKAKPELPVDIQDILDNTSHLDLRSRVKQFLREIPDYQGGDWTTNEVVNKAFIQELKNARIDTYQLVQQKYSEASKLRTSAKAATKIYNDIQEFIQNPNENTGKLHNAIEKSRELAIANFHGARKMDREAKELVARAIKLPYNIHINSEEEDDTRRTTFDKDTMDKIHQTRFENRLLKQASQNRDSHGSYGNRGRGGFRATSNQPRNFWNQQQQQSRPQRSNNPFLSHNNNYSNNNQYINDQPKKTNHHSHEPRQ